MRGALRFNVHVAGRLTAAYPSSDRFAATFSLKGRRVSRGKAEVLLLAIVTYCSLIRPPGAIYIPVRVLASALPNEPPSPPEGEGLGMRGALSFNWHP